MIQSAQGALAVCKAFCRTYFTARNPEAAAAYLSDDAVWLNGVTAEEVVAKPEAAAALAGGGACVWRSDVKELLLNETEITPDTRLVYGHIMLSATVGNTRRLAFSAVVRTAGETYEICSLHLRLPRDDDRRPSPSDHPPWGTLVFRVEGKTIDLIYNNDSATSILGFEKQEMADLIQTEKYRLIEPDDVFPAKEQYRRLLIEGTPFDIQLRGRVKHGTMWLRLFSQVVRREAGQRWLMVTLMDTLSVLDMQNRLRSMMDRNPGIVARFEVSSGRIRQTYRSERFLKMIGYEQHRELPDDVTDDFSMIHPQDRDMVQNAYIAVLHGAESVDITFRVRKADGEYLWTNLQASIYRFSEGKRLLQGAYTDVDRKMRMLQEAETAKKRLERVVTSLPVGVGMFEYDGANFRLLYLNEQFLQIVGMDREAFLAELAADRPLGMRTRAEIRSHLLSSRSRGSADGSAAIRRLPRPDGTFVWVRIANTYLHREKTTTIYSIFHDITDEMTLKQEDQRRPAPFRDILSAIKDTTIFDYDPENDTLCYSRLSLPSGDPSTELKPFVPMIMMSPLFHPNDRKRCRDAFDIHSEGPVQGTMEFRSQLLSSEYRWCRARYARLYGQDGKIFRIIGRLDDIQHEKGMETGARAMIDRETLYRRAVTAGALLALEYDLVTGQRIESGEDILPIWMDGGLSLRGMIDDLNRRMTRPYDDMEQERDSIAQQEWTRQLGGRSGSMARVRRMRLPGHEHAEPRWYRITLTTVSDPGSQRAYAFFTVNDIHENKAREIKAWEQINLDAQTGLPNQLCFTREVTQRLLDPEKKQCAMAVLRPADLARLYAADGQKAVDGLLTRMADALRKAVRSGESYCRLSSDEFALFIPNAESTASIRKRLNGLVIALQGGADRSDVHIGVAFFQDRHPITDVLLTQAKSALRRAEQDGNRIVFYSPD